ncbi:hypothetical protein Sps_00833 [Shewanella psychrophila]|uniref:Uncharacterized protein n=1 Tax=Shewanella psychrophila TaxID=225848 RepID=A0A1S6HKG4_9GAMM|nr:hypothetical protein Sps_00833 [Shewanella psychrophila]
MALRPKLKLDETSLFPAMSLTAVLVICALLSPSSQTWDSEQQDAKMLASLTTSLHVQFSFNRYQAGFACRENGWEFCQKWAYPRGLLA